MSVQQPRLCLAWSNTRLVVGFGGKTWGFLPKMVPISLYWGSRSHGVNFPASNTAERGNFEKSRARQKQLKWPITPILCQLDHFEVTCVFCIKVITLQKTERWNKREKIYVTFFLNQEEDEPSENLSNAGFKFKYSSEYLIMSI